MASKVQTHIVLTPQFWIKGAPKSPEEEIEEITAAQPFSEATSDAKYTVEHTLYLGCDFFVCVS